MSTMLIPLALMAIGAEPQTYPNAKLLVEPAALMKPERGKAVALDVRSAKSYGEGHIPGALHADAAAWAKAFTAEPEPAAWAKRLGDLGIQASSTVVVC